MNQFNSNSSNFIKNYFNNDQEESQIYPINQVAPIINYSKEFSEFINFASLGELEGVIRYLQKYRSNINNVDPNYGWTPLMHAANFGHYNVIKPLLDHGADSNFYPRKTKTTALMLAASNGHTRCIEMLIVVGKADIHLRDVNGFTAAYYAIHYGHGSNKIIARLLRIQFQNNNHNYQSVKQNHSNNQHSITNHLNTSLDSPNGNYSNDRYNLFQQQTNNLQHQNSSLNDENDFNQFDGFNNMSNLSCTSGRRFNIESNNMSNSLLSPTNQNNQSLSEILKLNSPKPRPITKQGQRRFSPVLNQQISQELQNGFSKDFNNNDAINNKAQQERNSFSSHQMMNSTTSNHSLRSVNLSLDINRPHSISFNGYSPDDQANNSFQQKGLNYFQYDSGVFESPQSAKSDLHHSFNDKSKLETGYYNFNMSLNDSLTGSSLKKSRNKPRNSTFVLGNDFNNSNNCSSNSNESSIENSLHSSLTNSPTNDLSTQPSSFEELTSLEMKYSDLASNLDEFLEQNDLKDKNLSELFAKHDIDLYKFLSLSEVDLRQIGITNPEHLATLIAGQLKFKEIIGIKSLESMNFIIYLGSQLEKSKKKLNSIKKELEIIKNNHLLGSLDNMGIYNKIEN